MPAEVEPQIEIVDKNEAGHIEKMVVKSPYTGYTTYFYVRIQNEPCRSFSTEKAARKYLYSRAKSLNQPRFQNTYRMPV